MAIVKLLAGNVWVNRIYGLFLAFTVAREFQKNIYFCFIDYAKAFVWITINCGKF